MLLPDKCPSFVQFRDIPRLVTFYWTMSQFSLIVHRCQPPFHWWNRGLINFPFYLLVISPTNLNLFSWFVIHCGRNQSYIPRCLWTQSLDSCSHQNTRAILLMNVYESVIWRLFTHRRLKLQRRTVKVMHTYFCQWSHTHRRSRTSRLNRPVSRRPDSNTNQSVSQPHLGRQHLHSWIRAQWRISLTSYQQQHGPGACTTHPSGPSVLRLCCCQLAPCCFCVCVCAHTTRDLAHAGRVIIMLHLRRHSGHAVH